MLMSACLAAWCMVLLTGRAVTATMFGCRELVHGGGVNGVGCVPCGDGNDGEA
jgi:hypothetical protein